MRAQGMRGDHLGNFHNLNQLPYNFYSLNGDVRGREEADILTPEPNLLDVCVLIIIYTASVYTLLTLCRQPYIASVYNMYISSDNTVECIQPIFRH
jgi:hypothetical protein